MREIGVDFLGLAEVTKSDLDRVWAESDLPEYSVYDGTLKDGRLQFDTGAIFNASRLNLVDQISFIECHGNQRLKLANRIDLTTNDDARPFHIFLSHWPSHIVPDSEQSRITLGMLLRAKLGQIMEGDASQARVIAMGDYNEEPFHEALQCQLLATRDRKLVTECPSILYNPFWRLLGESEAYSHGLTAESFAGTCFLRSGKVTRWKTVDQIIVSAAFLGVCPTNWS